MLAPAQLTEGVASLGAVSAARPSSQRPRTRLTAPLDVQDAASYPAALLKVLMTITDVRIIQYALTLIVDFLEVDDKRVRLFGKPGGDSNKPYVLPFLQLVGSTGSGARIVSTEANPYVVEQAALAASLLLSTDAGCEDATSVSSMLAWVLTNLQGFSQHNPRQNKVTEAALSALSLLLRHDFLKSLFVEERGVERLLRLTTVGNAQLLYYALYCLWTLSLSKVAAVTLEGAGAVPAIARVVRSGMPLKVLRMGLGTIANVARAPGASKALTGICESHLPDLVSSLLTTEPRLSDPELCDDLAFLAQATAGHAARSLTTMERYEVELAGRHLEWNAVHGSDFWRENAGAFEAKDFRLVKALAGLLADTLTDDTTLAVAVHDLGEFAVHHPQGRA